MKLKALSLVLAESYYPTNNCANCKTQSKTTNARNLMDSDLLQLALVLCVLGTVCWVVFTLHVLVLHGKWSKIGGHFVSFPICDFSPSFCLVTGAHLVDIVLSTCSVCLRVSSIASELHQFARNICAWFIYMSLSKLPYELELWRFVCVLGGLSAHRFHPIQANPNLKASPHSVGWCPFHSFPTLIPAFYPIRSTCLLILQVPRVPLVFVSKGLFG